MTEYELFQRAAQRLEESNEPTCIQTIMAVCPNTIVFCSSFFMLYYAYNVKGTNMEYTSPFVSTILSIIMFLMCILIIAYRHHIDFEFLSPMYKIIIRINIFHLILCGSFVSYVKTSGNYSTYFTWLYVVTIPIAILSFIPFVVYSYS